MSFAVPVLISARDRPLYLWATLDSLYRTTRYPHKFVLLDMASEDPAIRPVVAGFERRGMFDEVVWAERNDPKIIWSMMWRLGASGAPYIGHVESDVIVEPADPCWLERFVGLMERNPRLAMLGSAIDQTDFVDLQTARRLQKTMPEPQLRALIKADSIERRQDLGSAKGADIIQPHNPPARLMLMRNSALRQVGWGLDSQMHDKLCAAGYETGIATAVRHRHLSLLNIFDYPDYDTDARRRFMAEAARLPRELARELAASGDADRNRTRRLRPPRLSSYVAKLRSYFAGSRGAAEVGRE